MPYRSRSHLNRARSGGRQVVGKYKKKKKIRKELMTFRLQWYSIKKLGGGGAAAEWTTSSSSARAIRAREQIREAYIYIYIYNIIILLFLLLLCVHENRDHDDDHFENEAVRLSFSVDRFAIDWSNPIRAYIYAHIIYLPMCVSTCIYLFRPRRRLKIIYYIKVCVCLSIFVQVTCEVPTYICVCVYIFYI